MSARLWAPPAAIDRTPDRPSTGRARLTTAEKKRILTTHIFGVDIDRQAVEVTKLSLLLKALDAMRPAAPMPRGPVPTSMKSARKMMRG